MQVVCEVDITVNTLEDGIKQIVNEAITERLASLPQPKAQASVMDSDTVQEIRVCSHHGRRTQRSSRNRRGAVSYSYRSTG